MCRRGRSVLVSNLGSGLGNGVDHFRWHLLTAARAPSVGAAFRQALRHRLIAAIDGRLDQFTGSRSVAKLGILRQFQADPRLRPHRRAPA